MPTEQNVGQTFFIIAISATNFGETLRCVKCTCRMIVGEAPKIEHGAPGFSPVHQISTDAPAAQVRIEVKLLDPSWSSDDKAGDATIAARHRHLSRGDELRKESPILLARVEHRKKGQADGTRSAKQIDDLFQIIGLRSSQRDIGLCHRHGTGIAVQAAMPFHWV